MIDFTSLPKRKKAYAGANGSKISVVYENELYMLKFPPIPTRNKEMSYSNSCISEYIGCHIFQSAGIPVQETLLGTYTSQDKAKVVVACKDFTRPGIVLQDFASVKNQVIDSRRNGYGTELKDLLYAFENQNVIDSKILTERFWDMFVVDALIGNWDRHNGNWGFLYDTVNDSLTLAPVYDCGSSLYPQADDVLMEEILSNPQDLNYRIYEIPTSAITINGKRINYFRYLTSNDNQDCDAALLRIFPRISLNDIQSIVQDTPFISPLQKTFYQTMLEQRYEKILLPAYELATEHQAENTREAETDPENDFEL
mgnify:FL=1